VKAGTPEGGKNLLSGKSADCFLVSRSRGARCNKVVGGYDDSSSYDRRQHRHENGDNCRDKQDESQNSGYDLFGYGNERHESRSQINMIGPTFFLVSTTYGWWFSEFAHRK